MVQSAERKISEKIKIEEKQQCKEINSWITKLPDNEWDETWAFVLSLRNGKLYPALEYLLAPWKEKTELKSPKISPDEKVYDRLLTITKDKNVSEDIKSGVRILLGGPLFHKYRLREYARKMLKKMPRKTGPKTDFIRDVIIYELVLKFERALGTFVAAQNAVLQILATIGQRTSESNVRRIYEKVQRDIKEYISSQSLM